MKVKELVAELLKQDQEADVRISYWQDNGEDTGWETDESIFAVTSLQYTHKNKLINKVYLR